MRVELSKLKWCSENLTAEEFKAVIDGAIEYAETLTEPAFDPAGLRYPFLILKEEIDREVRTSENRSRAKTKATNGTIETIVTNDTKATKATSVTIETLVTKEDEEGNSFVGKEIKEYVLPQGEFAFEEEENECSSPEKERSKERIPLTQEKEQEIVPPLKENTKEKSPQPDGFEKFWAAYPKKVAKQDALKAWKQVKPNEATQALMLKAIERSKGSNQWREKQYIPFPATWLRGRRWEDESEVETSGRFIGTLDYSDDIAEAF